MPKQILLFSAACTIILTKLYFLLHTSPPPDISEIELYYFSYSLLNTPSLLHHLASFGSLKGYLLFFVPTIFCSITSWLSSLNLSFILATKFLLLTTTSLIFLCLTQLKLRLSPFLQTTAFLIFFLSPWANFIYIFHTPGALLLFFFVSFLLLNRLQKKLLSHLALLALSFTTWTGLIFTLAVTPYLKFPRSRKLLTYTIIILALLLQKPYVRQTFHNSFLPALLPQNLAQEINTHQKYSPSRLALVRKLTYNKPFVATSLIINHAISAFDFEQISSPLSSYSLISLSGLSPKNPPLLLIWELPLVLFGLYLIIIRKPRFSPFSFIIIASFLPYLIFPKPSFIHSMLLILPFLLVLEITALKHLFQKHRPLFILNLLLLILSQIQFQSRFLNRQSEYRYSHPHYFREISRWIIQNTDSSQPIVVTNRFGPTNLAYAFYSHSPPTLFWNSHEDTSPVLGNITFRPFHFSEEKNATDIIYIGFIGEFVNPGKHLEQRTPSDRITILRQLPGSEPIVTDYGDQIWITKIN